MPAERRTTLPAVKPVKTERTHEENQERAYIAASRRSDRSLEARIESARRASEIHKKRTGRALRVTEQDVVNEEMYEEEDDDLPTQYQRLNAHLQTSSWLFNRKLHDYIATQHGVRNMFLQQQFPGHQLQTYPSQFQSNPGQMPMMNQSMMPPQAFHANSHDFAPSPSGFQPPQHQSQSYRHAPYSLQRPQPHQRSASIATPQASAEFAPMPQPNAATTPRDEASRRMSLPAHAFEAAAQHTADSQARPQLSRTSTAQSVQQQQQQPVSPQRASASTPSTSTSGHETPRTKTEQTSPTIFQFNTFPMHPSQQVLDMNPLSLSLPPEAQQLVGSALDPNDPCTSLFMSGSENLPQPFSGTYTYNPNLSPKSTRANAGNMSHPGIAQTLAPEQLIKLETSADNTSSGTPPSALSEGLYTPQPLFTPSYEYASFFDNCQALDDNRNTSDGVFAEAYEDSSFVNWDQ